MAENGNIIDPCYDPALDGREIMRRLLEEAEATAKKQGLERITLVVPSDDPRMTGACRDMGMRGKKSDAKFAILVGNYERFLPVVLARGKAPDGLYLLSIRGRGGDEERILLTVSRGEVSAAAAGDNTSPDVTIHIRDVALNRLVFDGRLTFADFAMRRVKVRPVHKLKAGLAFMTCMKLGSKWFIPRGGTI